MGSPASWVVAWGDTLQGISTALTGDPANWPILAAWNNLTWPYLTDDPSAYAPTAATGSVTVTGPTASSWTVPEGFLFAQPALPNGGYQVQYAATQAVSGGSGTPTVAVPVACTQTGPVGNCGPGAITVLVSSGLPAGTVCTNAAAFTGGAAPNVLGPGATLLIPPGWSGGPAGPSPPQPQTWLEIIGGTSLQLTPGGDLAVTASGSLATLTGADNLLQHWSLMILTQLGDMPLHPTFGTELDVLAASGAPNAGDLILSDIRTVLLSDPRVAQVATLALASASPQVLQVSATVLPVGSSTAIPLSVLLGG